MKQGIWIATLVVLLTLSGCLATSQQLTMERNLSEIKRRLAETERGLAALRLERSTETQERLNELHRRTADQQAHLDAFRVEFQSFYGRLEDFSRTNSQLAADLGLTQDELSIKLTALENRLTALERAKPDPPPVSTATPLPPKKVTFTTDTDPEAFYQAALRLLREQGEYATAREQLGAFVEHFTNHPLRGNASYWIGEAYFAEKKFDQAILQFQQVIDNYSGHAKVPAALLMQGTAFHLLGDTESGKVILRQLLSKHPETAEARKAEARLEEWGTKK